MGRAWNLRLKWLVDNFPRQINVPECFNVVRGVRCRDWVRAPSLTSDLLQLMCLICHQIIFEYGRLQFAGCTGRCVNNLFANGKCSSYYCTCLLAVW